MDVERDEEHRRAIGVDIADQPPVIDITHDVLGGVESQPGIRGIVHRQHDAGDNLYTETECEDGAEGVPDVQVARRRKDRE